MVHAEDSGMDESIMTLAEVAEFLKLGQRTVLRMVHDQEIPAMRIGNQWRFMGSTIRNWLRTKVEGAPKDELTRLIETEEGSVPVSRLIVPHYVALDIKPGSRRDVLEQLVEPIITHNGLDTDTQEKFVDDLLVREAMRSTVVAGGIAFPHLRNPADSPVTGPFIQIGRCPEGTDFDSPDSKPIYVFGLVCTISIIVHLRLLAALSHVVNTSGFLEMILNAGSVDSVLSGILEIEQNERIGGDSGRS